ncbi:MAG TPA: tetratricopeptide repeat protein [Candidatus Acidoferrales bacterium]|nr:tetratricopeptide repeat protein [Candidatus Acidoferrales bacterium]
MSESELRGGVPARVGSEDSVGNAPWLFPMIAVLVIAAAYLRAPTLGFVFDDDIIVKANPFITSASHIPSYFTEHVWSKLMLARKNYYRPVFLLWLLGNYEAFGLDPLGWHMSSLLLHLGSAVLVYFVALRLTGMRFASLAGALLFGLHPAQVENVVWASASTELLGSFLTLASVLCYLRSLDTGARRLAWLSASALLYAMAVLTKETAIIVPLLVFLHEWWGRPASPEAARPGERGYGAAFAAGARESLLFAVVTLCYLAARFAVLGGIGNTVVKMTKTVWVETIPSILKVYAVHLLWPARLSAFYDYPYVEQFSVRQVVAPALVVLVLAGVLVLAIRHTPGARLAAVWMAFPILPVLDIPIFPRGEFLHDRYLYQPLIGLGLLAALGLAALGRRWRTDAARWAEYGACGAVALALGAATFVQTGYWTDNMALYTRGVEVAPRNAFANLNLGVELLNRGRWAEAMAQFQKALECAPKFYLAQYDLGYGYYVIGKYAEAEPYFRRAVEIMPEDPESNMYLGMTYYHMNRTAPAMEYVRKAIALKPDGRGYHFALGVMLKDAGDAAGARAEFGKELQRDPANQATLEQLRALETPASSAAAHP